MRRVLRAQRGRGCQCHSLLVAAGVEVLTLGQVALVDERWDDVRLLEVKVVVRAKDV